MEPVSPENKSLSEPTIRLGQEFRPFTLPNLHMDTERDFTFDQSIVGVTLASDVLPHLPFIITAMGTFSYSEPVLTPFLPKNGYRIT